MKKKKTKATNELKIKMVKKGEFILYFVYQIEE